MRLTVDRRRVGRLLLLSAFFPLVFVLTIQSESAEVDWPAVEREAGELLSHYIRIDTTNPPGNETAAALFWKGVLARDGLEAQVLESQPGRGIVYARLKGT